MSRGLRLVQLTVRMLAMSAFTVTILIDVIYPTATEPTYAIFIQNIL